MNKTTIVFLGLAALLSFSLPTFSQPSQNAPGLLAQATVDDIVTLGPLKLGMAEEEAKSVLGAPETETEAQVIPAFGTYGKQWLYPEKGIGIALSSENPSGPFTIESITLEEPSTYQGAAGIGIGMLETEAYNRFKTMLTEDINSFEVEEDKFGVTINSTYQVLVVGCVDGVVKHIYLGPGPE